MSAEPGQSSNDGSNGGLDDPKFWEALRRVTGKIIDALESSARSDETFRADLQRLLRVGGAGWNGADDDGQQAPPSEESTETEAPALEAAAPVCFAERRPVAPESLAPRLVSPAPAPAGGGAATGAYRPQWTREPFDPDSVAAACRMKAEACRWQSERSRRLDMGEDVSAGDMQLVARAREKGVWLWMVSPNKWRERSEDAFVVVGGCYDALADAAELMGLADAVGVEQDEALQLLGEAQSALRAALEDYASTRRDDDQERTFAWLGQETKARRIYIEHMQLDHPAPPQAHAELRRRIAAVRAILDGYRQREQEVERTFKKLQWHAGRIARRAPSEPVAPMDPDLARVAECAASLIEDAQVPPSDTRLREALLPLIDRVTDDLEEPSFRSLQRILGTIQDYLDERAADADAVDERAPAREDAELERARQLVGGRDAVLIGGRPSELHRARLERGLGLRSLDWVRVEHHESFGAAEVAIRRPGVGLVLLMTRWRSHRDGPAARQLCKSLGIPLVELPAGYNIRQVAHRIVEQLGSPATSE